MLHNPKCLNSTPQNLYYPPAEGDYGYFEGPPFRATPGFQYAKASWAADASMFAYARYGQTRMTAGQFQEVLRRAGFMITETIGDCFVDGAATARGFFAGTNDFAILAFRGAEKDNSRDIETDLDAIPISEDPLGGRSAGRVHQGFQRYLSSVWATVTQLVSDYRSGHKQQEICITGHSLGAAIATLAFHQLQDARVSLYTFGCPRVGTQAFCDDLMETTRTRGCYRVVDNQDFVTHVPFHLGLLGYKHPSCTVFWINPDHAVIQSPPSLPSDFADVEGSAMDYLRGRVVDPVPGSLADHSPVRYCHWLSQRAAAGAATQG